MSPAIAFVPEARRRHFAQTGVGAGRRARLAVLALAIAAAIGAADLRAAGDLTRQAPIEVRMLLGTEQDAKLFSPAVLEFETGKLYKLVLHNPSPEPHYFTSIAFAGSVFTRKVQVNGPDGKAIGEIKGNVFEIEVFPKGTTEWWFVPVRTGEFGDLRCTIKGHDEMRGKLVIR
jgi:uncharacterized cupredoxin-like copper-binding protein